MKKTTKKAKTKVDQHSAVTDVIVKELQLNDVDAACIEDAFDELGRSCGSFNATVTTFTADGRLEKSMHGGFTNTGAYIEARNSCMLFVSNDWTEVKAGDRKLTHVSFHHP